MVKSNLSEGESGSMSHLKKTWIIKVPQQRKSLSKRDKDKAMCHGEREEKEGREEGKDLKEKAFMVHRFT